MDKRTFDEQLAMARKLVASWPTWKQNLLEDMAKPTVAVPRQPVDNFRQPVSGNSNEEARQEKRMRKRIYVAGAISTGNVGDNVAAAHRAGLELLRAGFAPMVPHGCCFWGNQKQGEAFCPQVSPEDVSHQVWLEVDFPWVAVSDALLRLPGESKGADAEVQLAQSLKIPVFFSLQDLLRAYQS